MGCSASAPLPIPSTEASVIFTPDPSKADAPDPLSGPIRRHPSVAHPGAELETSVAPDFTTLYEAFERGVKVSGDGNCMGYRTVSSVTTAEGESKEEWGDFTWFTYNQIRDMRNKIGSAMHSENLIPLVEHEGAPALRLTALFSKNRYEWVVVEQACNAYGGVSVALYDTLGADSVAYILEQTSISTIWAAKSEVSKILEAHAANPEGMSHVKTIVQFEDTTPADEEVCAKSGISLRSFNQMLEVGEKNPMEPTPPSPGDIATFCYTSGTTGAPKGAMLTHGNLCADAAGAMLAGLQMMSSDVHLSYLPLAHMFERMIQLTLWYQGAQVGFFRGSPQFLLEDIAVLRPTLFPSVPRLFNRIYDKIVAGAEAQGGLKAKMFRKALATKSANLRDNIVAHGLYDKVFMKIKVRLGFDRVRAVVTGSAPLAAHVMDFLKVMFACPVFEGYGQTESSAASTLTDKNDVMTSGHVGAPLPCNEIKLVSVEEMGYRWDDKFHGRVRSLDGGIESQGIPCLGRGEICVRGPNVFPGYYRNPEKTAEALDENGWLHSGDIGVWTTQGHLRIVDRKKNIFKLAQGEYCAPEKIENVYGRSPLIAQSFVYGDSFQAVLVAFVVLDPEGMAAWAPANNIKGTTMAEWVADPDVKAAVLADIKRIGRGDGKLKGFEIVKDLRLVAEMFSVENNLLTPTFKLKRNEAKKRFQAQIDEMYAGLGGVAGKHVKQGDVEESKSSA